MTLVLTVNGSDSIWMVADRRLSYRGLRAARDDARKFMFLEATDGKAIIGYAGLGATAWGTQPADWIAATLRGQRLTMEQALSVLASAARREIPRHLVGISNHSFVATALVGDQPRLYTVDFALSPNRREWRWRYTKQVTSLGQGASERTPPLSLGGSGAACLMRRHDWERPLLHLVRAFDRGRVSALAVADHLAGVNMGAHRETPDSTVGPSCIVGWRNAEGADRDGGGEQFYDGTRRIGADQVIPTIANGFEVSAIMRVLAPEFARMSMALREGADHVAPDVQELNRRMDELPKKPDDRLR